MLCIKRLQRYVFSSSLKLLMSTILISCLPLSAMAGQNEAPEPGASIESPVYLLSSGDVLEIKFNYNPELDETVTVRPDGKIALLWVGEIEAADLAPSELAQRLSEAYVHYVRHPEVTVLVREFAEQIVYVGGEVRLPGTVPLRGRLTGLRAVLDRGGAKPSASLGSVILIRRQGNEATLVSKLDLNDVIKGKEEDVELQPFDVVFVPPKTIAKVGLFVEQYINSLIPRNLHFQYNLNNIVTVR